MGEGAYMRGLSESKKRFKKVRTKQGKAEMVDEVGGFLSVIGVCLCVCITFLP